MPAISFKPLYVDRHFVIKHISSVEIMQQEIPSINQLWKCKINSSSNFIPNRKQSTAYMSRDTTSVN